jgi:hypothetical protein
MAELDRTAPTWRTLRSGTASSKANPFIACAIGLGALSLLLSAATATSRSRLFLGPQTLVLGAAGVLIGILVIWCARMLARAPSTPLLNATSFPKVTVFIAVGGASLLALLIIYFAFNTFANSADEAGFLYQAATFSNGRLWNTPPPDPGLFEQNYVIAARNGMWLSQYLPAWPAILAMFEVVHLPPWFASPVCGAALLLLLWKCLRLESTNQALSVAILLAYASTGFFLLNAATYFSHCASALIVVGTIVCILQAERNPAWYWPVSAGACLGAAALCRVDSAALVGVALLAGWIEQGYRRHTLLLGLAGAAPPLILFCIYNWMVTGNPILVPTAWSGLLTPERPIGELRIFVQTFWRLGELADTASLVIPLLYFVALALRLRDRRLRFYDVVPLANLAVFLLYPDNGGFQMGPRYWFDGFATMHITIASEFSRRPLEWQRFVIACCLLLIPVSLARLPAQVQFQARMMHERSSVFRLASTLSSDRRSVILVNDFFSTWNDRNNRTAPNFAKDFVRNGVSLDKPVLFVRGDAPNALARACALYPQASMFAFHLDREHPNGSLTPLSCTHPAT